MIAVSIGLLFKLQDNADEAHAAAVSNLELMNGLVASVAVTNEQVAALNKQLESISSSAKPPPLGPGQGLVQEGPGQVEGAVEGRRVSRMATPERRTSNLPPDPAAETHPTDDAVEPDGAQSPGSDLGLGHDRPARGGTRAGAGSTLV